MSDPLTQALTAPSYRQTENLNIGATTWCGSARISSFIALTGGPGVGKSHLAFALHRAILASNLGQTEICWPLDTSDPVAMGKSVVTFKCMATGTPPDMPGQDTHFPPGSLDRYLRWLPKNTDRVHAYNAGWESVFFRGNSFVCPTEHTATVQIALTPDARDVVLVRPTIAEFTAILKDMPNKDGHLLIVDDLGFDRMRLDTVVADENNQQGLTQKELFALASAMATFHENNMTKPEEKRSLVIITSNQPFFRNGWPLLRRPGLLDLIHRTVDPDNRLGSRLQDGMREITFRDSISRRNGTGGPALLPFRLERQAMERAARFVSALLTPRF